MSVKYESFCVGCRPDLHCLGAACPYHAPSPVFYCDICEEAAEYRIDGNDLCEDHAKEYLVELFKGLTVKEMAELLEADFSYAENT